MNTEEVNRQDIEAELERIQEKLALIRTKVKSSATDAQISYAEEIEILELQAVTAKAKLKIFDETNDDTFEQFISGVGLCLSALRSAFRDTAAKLKD